MRRVLHVVEAYGAGTASAMHQYVTATPELEHHLIRRHREGEHVDDGETADLASVRELPDGVVGAVRAVRTAVRHLRPDAVHAHSSFAGAFARLALSTGRRPLVVYTPHCYVTEREDLGRVPRAAFGLAERLLAPYTDVVAACSPREAHLAGRLTPRASRVWVPNTTDVRPSAARPGAGATYVAGMGRLAPQRDPGFFIETVSRLRAQALADVRAVWIGGGDADRTAALEHAGVEVTGWLPRSEALRVLEESSVYLHTAAWDGAPMTIVEAWALGVPVVARRTLALEDCPADTLGATPHQVAEAAAAVLAGEPALKANRAAWDDYFAEHTVERQRDALLAAYGHGAAR